jgi:hypothetical protein
MPKLTIRSLAEMIHKPMYDQIRILNEQKYPKDEPNVFRIPFYKPALEVIKIYYKTSNDDRVFDEWSEYTAPNLKPQPKKINNLRVIQAFRNHNISNRFLTISKSINSYKIIPDKNIELKLTFDIEAEEKNKTVFLFFNFRQYPIDGEIAKDTLQIAYWLLQQNDIKITVANLEFIDLANGTIWKINRPSTRTINNMKNNFLVINALWDSI